MANIKSAKKRIKIIARQTLENKIVKSQVKMAIKKVTAATMSKDKTAANEAFTNAMSTISKARTKGVFHKKTAARKISRLAKRVNKIEA
ncbi:MAG TPA: 30S ribosomal protein S20 [Clostridiales bacterium]|nr:MAG: 30S ribosomal protein S20 [Clostridiales bacterium GWD2_32_19]HCC08170.1 30S ribosomal protein S20 [Clostridiales bacterium]